jgi:hypothetical protein
MKSELKHRLAPFLALLDARFAPLLVVALPQAWVVYQWLDNRKYEFWSNFFAVIGAIGFEAVYVGVIAWAEGRANRGWVRATSITALVFSALVAVKVYWPGWEAMGWIGELSGALLHAGFPLLAYCYTMTIHSALSGGNAERPIQVNLHRGARVAINEDTTGAADSGGTNIPDLETLLEETEPVTVAASNSAQPGRRGQVLEMRGQNKTWQEVAQHFGVSVRTAQNWAKE